MQATAQPVLPQKLDKAKLEAICRWHASNRIAAAMFNADLRNSITPLFGDKAWPDPDRETITLPTAAEDEMVRCKGVKQALLHIWQHGLAIPVLEIYEDTWSQLERQQAAAAGEAASDQDVEVVHEEEGEEEEEDVQELHGAAAAAGSSGPAAAFAARAAAAAAARGSKLLGGKRKDPPAAAASRPNNPQPGSTLRMPYEDFNGAPSHRLPLAEGPLKSPRKPPPAAMPTVGTLGHTHLPPTPAVVSGQQAKQASSGTDKHQLQAGSGNGKKEQEASVVTPMGAPAVPRGGLAVEPGAAAAGQLAPPAAGPAAAVAGEQLTAPAAAAVAAAPSAETINSFPVDLLKSEPVQLALSVMPSAAITQLRKAAHLHRLCLQKELKLLLQQQEVKKQQIVEAAEAALAVLAAAEADITRAGGLRTMAHGLGFVRAIEEGFERAKQQIAAEAARVAEEGAGALKVHKDGLDRQIAAAAVRSLVLRQVLQAVQEEEQFEAEQRADADAAAGQEAAGGAAAAGVAAAVGDEQLVAKQQAVVDAGVEQEAAIGAADDSGLATAPVQHEASEQQPAAPQKRARYWPWSS